MRKTQVFFLKNSREIGRKASIPSRRHPMGVGGLYNPRTCRAGPACPAARYELLPAGHMGPALQSTVAAQGGQSRPPLQNSREIGGKCHKRSKRAAHAALRLSKNLPGYKYRREGYHRLARANTPDSVSFRRFLLFSPWRAPARLRLKKQKSLENPSLAGAEQFCRSRNVSRQEKTRREYLPYCQGA